MANSIDYKRLLNPAQLEAVMTVEGPVLVIAGAGSGKTRTLIYRVARLVETGVEPESILLLTFTRKAAQEMLERASSLADPRCRFVSGGTFHSLANRVLRIHAGHLGFDNTFTILDRSDMEEVIRSLVPQLGILKGALRFPRTSTLANILSKAANLGRRVDDLVSGEYTQFIHCVSELSRLGELYRDYKKTHQMMDYDDLILNFRRLLAENNEVRQALSLQYRYVMVDEYQDTNGIQADIVKWLAHEHRNIMVVGDDSQSIYSFRGANYRNMFDFTATFPEARIIKLEENYRSTQPILTMTNALMEQASEKHTKCLFTKRKDGERPRVVDTRTEPEQAMFVCRYIQEALGRGRSLREFAVLFRAGYHSFELEAELTRQGIRYVKYGGFRFLESAHIKDFLAHLRVAANPDDTLSWIRILRLVRQVGQGRSQAIVKWMKEEGVGPEGVGRWPGMAGKEGGLGKLSGLFRSISSIKGPPRKAVERVMEYYLPILKEKFDDYPRRQKELDQLLPMASRYRSLRSFLDDLIIEPPTSPADMDREQRSEVLTLSTVHSAKGLEWPVVIIIWVAEGRFPIPSSYGNPSDLEEERRLMYVAATRARDQLILCYPGQETAPPWHDQTVARGRGNGLSSFIRDLPSEVVSFESAGWVDISSGRKRPQVRRIPHEIKIQSDGIALSQGDRVTHPAFGPGVISKFVGDDKVEVLFMKAGRKLLHLHYTSLQKT